MVSYHSWQFGDEGGLNFLSLQSGTGWLPSGSTDFFAPKGAPAQL